MTKKLKTTLIAAAVILGVVAFFKWSPFGTDLLWQMSQGGKLLFPLVTVAALLDSINPCAFSILLITVAFLMSLKESRFYIVGIFAVYVLIGLGLLQALHLFNTPHFMAKAAAGVLILFGLINLINHYFPRFPIKLKIPDAAHAKIGELIKKATLPGAFLLGALVGLCEFPCTGGPYLLVLGLLHDSGTYARGFLYLIYYNIVFILPLAIALILASNELLCNKVNEWRKSENPKLKLGVSIAMIGLGLLMFAL